MKIMYTGLGGDWHVRSNCMTDLVVPLLVAYSARSVTESPLWAEIAMIEAMPLPIGHGVAVSE